MAEDTFASIEALLAQHDGRPPIEKWHPQLSGDIDIVIQADGRWFHEGGHIAREKLVALFASILRKEADGDYYLLTPVEKWRIQVDDSPFIVTELEVFDQGLESQSLVFTVNVGGKYLLSNDYRLDINVDAKTLEPRPYLNLDRGLHAKLSRSVFYRLVDLAVQRDDELFVVSNGVEFSLGSIEA